MSEALTERNARRIFDRLAADDYEVSLIHKPATEDALMGAQGASWRVLVLGNVEAGGLRRLLAMAEANDAAIETTPSGIVFS